MIICLDCGHAIKGKVLAHYKKYHKETFNKYYGKEAQKKWRERCQINEKAA